MNCIKCGGVIVQSQSPQEHYSTPENVCFHCSVRANAKVGDWLQHTNGEYYQKEEEKK